MAQMRRCGYWYTRKMSPVGYVFKQIRTICSSTVSLWIIRLIIGEPRATRVHRRRNVSTVSRWNLVANARRAECDRSHTSCMRNQQSKLTKSFAVANVCFKSRDLQVCVQIWRVILRNQEIPQIWCKVNSWIRMLVVDSQLEVSKVINLLCLYCVGYMQQIYYKPQPIATISIEKHLFSVFPQQNSVHVVVSVWSVT